MVEENIILVTKTITRQVSSID